MEQKEEDLLPQDHTLAADESQTQTTEEPEPVTVDFAGNCKLQHFASGDAYHWNTDYRLLRCPVASPVIATCQGQLN